MPPHLTAVTFPRRRARSASPPAPTTHRRPKSPRHPRPLSPLPADLAARHTRTLHHRPANAPPSPRGPHPQQKAPSQKAESDTENARNTDRETTVHRKKSDHTSESLQPPTDHPATQTRATTTTSATPGPTATNTAAASAVVPAAANPNNKRRRAALLSNFSFVSAFVTFIFHAIQSVLRRRRKKLPSTPPAPSKAPSAPTSTSTSSSAATARPSSSTTLPSASIREPPKHTRPRRRLPLSFRLPRLLPRLPRLPLPLPLRSPGAKPLAMAPTRTSILWGFIAMLGALAFLRTLAPNRTELAIRHLLTSETPAATDRLATERRALQAVRDQIERERLALDDLKKRIDDASASAAAGGGGSGDNNAAAVVKADVIDGSAPAPMSKEEEEAALAPGLKEAGLAAVNGTKEDTQTATHAAEAGVDAPPTGPPPLAPVVDPARGEGGAADAAATGETKAGSAAAAEPVAAKDPDQLAEGDCPTVVIPELTSAGLGAQIEHVWNSLSVTLALRNACVVLPPFMGHTPSKMYHPVRFGRIWDEAKLFSHTGLRSVSARACISTKVHSIFDDAGATTRVINTFKQHLAQAYPTLSSKTLIGDKTFAFRFPNASAVNDNVINVANYIQERTVLHPPNIPRYCVVLGRMRAPIGINPDVVRGFRAAPSVARFVTARFGNAESIVFVRLRWTDPVCSKLSPGQVCLMHGATASVGDYAHAIALAVQKANATQVYVAAPATVPESVRAFLAERLPVIESVLLQVEGDFFSANVVERELAVRSRVFVPDGGRWGASVQMSRKSLHPHLHNEGFSSQVMIDEWRAEGSPLLAGPVALGVRPADKQPDSIHFAAAPAPATAPATAPAQAPAPAPANAVAQAPDPGASQPQVQAAAQAPSQAQVNTAGQTPDQGAPGAIAVANTNAVQQQAPPAAIAPQSGRSANGVGNVGQATAPDTSESGSDANLRLNAPQSAAQGQVDNSGEERQIPGQQQRQSSAEVTGEQARTENSWDTNNESGEEYQRERENEFGGERKEAGGWNEQANGGAGADDEDLAQWGNSDDDDEDLEIKREALRLRRMHRAQQEQQQQAMLAAF